MSKVLTIDTSDNKKISIGLDIDGKKNEIREDSTTLRSEAALPAISKLCKKNKISLTELDEIRVNKGPGSFTGLRVGVSIANALGYLLKIPINGKKIGELEEPVYNEYIS
jgi:tRNA threonylcarbamoyladenosine biosynthesis protein TsaB